ncbi:MAG: biopolymer transporter ExbD [Gammaproteobacteria bacterium]|nr:biopolymer transporter ExbD [Gammaproteobacteria bacterium]
MIERRKRREVKTGLNLVSLMDIFTILVFFLLVNSSDVQTLPSQKGMQMPESVAQMAPRQTLVLSITPEQILVEDEAVISVAAALATENNVVAQLRDALLAKKLPALANDQTEITIMGDRKLPYRLLKKVMSTCADANFERVSLAVVRRAPAGTEG